MKESINEVDYCLQKLEKLSENGQYTSPAEIRTWFAVSFFIFVILLTVASAFTLVKETYMCTNSLRHEFANQGISHSRQINDISTGFVM